LRVVGEARRGLRRIEHEHAANPDCGRIAVFLSCVAGRPAAGPMALRIGAVTAV
jgi:hypothetical protein